MQSEFEDPEEVELERPNHFTASERLYNQAMDSKARVREAAQRAIQVSLGFTASPCLVGTMMTQLIYTTMKRMSDDQHKMSMACRRLKVHGKWFR